MDRKHIILVIENYANGGSERRATVLANSLVEYGYRVTILVTKRIDNDIFYERDDRVEVVLLPEYYEKNVPKVEKERIQRILEQDRRALKRKYKIAKSFSKIRKRINRKLDLIGDTLQLRAYFSENQKSIVIAFNIFVYEQICYASENYECKLVYTGTNSPQREMPKSKRELLANVVDKTLRKAYVCVFQTQGQLLHYKKHIGNKGVVIRNPILANLSAPYCGKRKKEIVNFCRMTPEKNLTLLIDAFSVLHKEFPDYKLLIYGIVSSKASQEYKKEILNHIKANQMDDAVAVLPASSDVHNMIIKSAMFVSSSDCEGLSNSMLEAMALGLPCICTDCLGGGAREMIHDGENGLLVPVKDTDALYRAMKRMIEEPGLADKCGRNASLIKSELSTEMISAQWINIINKI